MTTAAWILLPFFILLDIYFNLLRAAMFNARLPQLLELSSTDEKRVERTLKTLEKPRLRATLRLLVGLAHALVLACVLWLVLSSEKTPSIAGWLGIFVLAIFTLVALEFAIERYPLQRAEAWALRLAPSAALLDRLFSPLTSILVGLQGTSNLAQRNPGSVTEDELKTWVEVGQPEGGLEEDERKMIYSIFQFGDTLCREIMVPRTVVLAMDVNTPLDKAINLLVESGHSRVPVYDEVIDNVVGMLYAKDLLKVPRDAAEPPSIRQFLRPAYFVPESKKVDELLAEMQSRGVHISVVVDEYGGMAGLVTLEDIVEEIVGEIRDEYDQGEELLVQELSKDEFVFLGRVSLDDFNDALSTHLDPEQTDTLGGYFYNQMGRVPAEKDTLYVDDWKLTVEEVRGRRVGRIRATRNNNEDKLEVEEEHG